MIPETIHRKELAELIEVTPRRIDQLSEDGHLPKGEKGEFNFREAIRMLLAREKKEKTPAIERLNLAKAKREERKDRQEAGDDISAPVAIRATDNIRETTRQRIMRIGNNVQSKCGMTESQRLILDNECRDALSELSKQIDFAKHLAESEGDEAAIEALSPKLNEG